MSQTVFGAPATVTFLNRAFNNTAPGNLLFQNQVGAAGTTRESQEAFARTFANSFSSLSNEALATLVLTNMGVLPSEEAAVVALETELATYFGANAPADRGLIVLQLSEILATLAGATGDLAVYAPAAAAWNNEITKSFEYSVVPSNTATADPLDVPPVDPNPIQNYTLTTTQDVLSGTEGANTIRGVAGAAIGQQDQSTLNSSDIIDGKGGDDTLIVLLNNNYGGGATIKNVETLQIGTNNVGAVAFDYNVNQGNYEVTGVTKVVADQINTGEALSINNLVRADGATGEIPVLSWMNDSTAANGQAGTVNVNYRAAAVSGTTDQQTFELTNVRDGVLNISNGLETVVLKSLGTSTNSIRNLDSITAGSSSLTKVVIEATAQLGAGREVQTATGTLTTNVGLEDATNPTNGNTKHTSFMTVGARVTEIDASTSTAGVNVAFADATTAVNNTFKGGEGNDTVVLLGGNDNVSGGKGNDTVVFKQTTTSSNGLFFNNSDTVVGGEGSDTILIDYAKDSATVPTQVTIQASEWLNVSGVDALDIRAQNSRVQLDDAMIGRSDANTFEVVTNKIVQSDSTTSRADEANSRHQIDLTTVGANRNVKVTGGEGRETVIVTDALNGTSSLSGGNGLDVLVVQNGATLTGQDLQNVSGFNVMNLVKTSNNAQTFNVDLTAAFLTSAVDTNVAGGISKNVANAFRLITDTNYSNTVGTDALGALSGVQAIGATDTLNITVDTTGITAAGAINLADILNSGAAVNVTNTQGQTLLTKPAGVGAAITVNAAVAGNIFTGAAAAENTTLTNTTVAGVGTPLASGQASGGTGGVVTSTAFMLTTGTTNLTTGTNTGTDQAGTTNYLNSSANTITDNSGFLGAGDIITDGTSGDGDVMNVTLLAAAGAAGQTVTNIETINITNGSGVASVYNATSTTGTTTYGVNGNGGVTITNAGTGQTVNLNSSQALVINPLVDTGVDTITLNLAGGLSAAASIDTNVGTDYETLTINSNTSANVLTLTDVVGLTTMNTAGVAALELQLNEANSVALAAAALTDTTTGGLTLRHTAALAAANRDFATNATGIDRIVYAADNGGGETTTVDIGTTVEFAAGQTGANTLVSLAAQMTGSTDRINLVLSTAGVTAYGTPTVGAGIEQLGISATGASGRATVTDVDFVTQTTDDRVVISGTQDLTFAGMTEADVVDATAYASVSTTQGALTVTTGGAAAQTVNSSSVAAGDVFIAANLAGATTFNMNGGFDQVTPDIGSAQTIRTNATADNNSVEVGAGVVFTVGEDFFNYVGSVRNDTNINTDTSLAAGVNLNTLLGNAGATVFVATTNATAGQFITDAAYNAYTAATTVAAKQAAEQTIENEFIAILNGQANRTQLIDGERVIISLEADTLGNNLVFVVDGQTDGVWEDANVTLIGTITSDVVLTAAEIGFATV